MKFLKVLVRKQGTKLLYPPNYHQITFRAAGYVKEKGTVGNLYVLGIADDGEAAKITGHADVEELTKAAAKKFSEDNQDKDIIITNEARIRRIEIKQRAGDTLTAEDNKALDENDETVKGFGKQEIISDRIASEVAKEAALNP